MIKIDKNLPVPELEVGRVAKYPYRQMKVGDSFAIPYDDDVDAYRTTRNALACSRNLRKKGIRFTSRKDSDNKVIRIWRIE